MFNIKKHALEKKISVIKSKRSIKNIVLLATNELYGSLDWLLKKIINNKMFVKQFVKIKR